MPIKKTPEKKTSVKQSSERKTSVKKSSEKKTVETKTCPYCGNEIKAAAKKCQYCGEWFQKPRAKSESTHYETRREYEHKENSFVSFVTGTNLNRTGRAKYFARTLIWGILTYLSSLIAMGLISFGEDGDGGTLFTVIGGIWGLVVLFFSIYGGVYINNKRLHDRGWSGWCQLLLLIPFVGSILGICMWAVPGNKGENEYGEPCESKIREKVISIICILIIPVGIFIAALMPRMQSAQGRARDVARKTALSQIQSAIVVSQYDKGMWPGGSSAKNGIPVSNIKSDLLSAGMSSVPTDPLSNNKISGLGNTTSQGEYIYLVAKRNNVDAGGFVLMAKTEVPGGSNWVVCNDSNEGHITSQTDLYKLTLCSTISKGDSCSNSNGYCTYSDDDELRYIVIY